MQAELIQTLPPTTFLVVDDDPQNLELLVRLVRRDGHPLFEATTGEQALALGRAHRPGIVLLDVVLPDISGLEVCRRIKADPAFTGTFVVLISSKEITTDSKVEGLYHGADDYIVRPLPSRELRARLQTIVRLQRAEAALRESNRFNEQIIASAREGVVVYDRDLLCRVWNPFLEELCAVPAEQVLGRHPLEVFPQLKTLGVYSHLERALAGETVTSLDVPLALTGCERVVWVVAKHGPLRNAAGEIIGVLGTINDVTQRRHAVSKMEHLNHYLDHCVTEHAAALVAVRQSLADESAARLRAEAALQAAATRPAKA